MHRPGIAIDTAMFAAAVGIQACGKSDIGAVIEIDDAFGGIAVKFRLETRPFLGLIQVVAIRLEFDLVETGARVVGSATAFDHGMRRKIHAPILPHK